jgi:hypothetical protein
VQRSGKIRYAEQLRKNGVSGPMHVTEQGAWRICGNPMNRLIPEKKTPSWKCERVSSEMDQAFCRL